MSFLQKNSYLLAILLVCIVFSIVGIISNQHHDAYDEITIHEGDTLWELAMQYGEQSATNRWIQEVISINNLPNSTIRAGETLKIPLITPTFNENIVTEYAGNE